MGRTKPQKKICFFCQTPIPSDETIRGATCQTPTGEPVCVGCHQDIQKLIREEKRMAKEASKKRKESDYRVN